MTTESTAARLQFYDRITQDPELTHLDCRVAWRVLTRVNDNHAGWAWPSYPTIANEINAHADSVRRSVKRLRERGWFEVVSRRGSRQSCRYRPKIGNRTEGHGMGDDGNRTQQSGLDDAATANRTQQSEKPYPAVGKTVPESPTEPSHESFNELSQYIRPKKPSVAEPVLPPKPLEQMTTVERLAWERQNRIAEAGGNH